MPALPFYGRLLIGLIGGVGLVLAGLIGQALWANIVYLFTRRGRKPKSRPLRLWITFYISVIVSVALGVFASIAPPIKIPPVNQAAVTITNPQDGEQIDRIIAVSGRALNTRGQLVWVYVYAPGTRLYYIQGSTTPSYIGNWVLEHVYVGSKDASDIGQTFIIGAIVTKEALPSTISNLPKGPGDQITVIRK
jgi:hypothetical protein